ncbi:MAG: 4Fe-4S dicluster domain-containing protein [Desulfobacteraceae bacterium]
MTKKPFFGFGRPKLKHVRLDHLTQPEIKPIPLPARLTVFLNHAAEAKDLGIRSGTTVKTGEKLPYKGIGGYFVSPATGTIQGISENRTYTDRRFLAITIQVEGKDKWDPQFTEAAQSPGPETALDYLAFLPGISDFTSLISRDTPLHTLIINGTDSDLLILTNQLLMNAGPEDIKAGLAHLSKVSGIDQVMVVVPPDLRTQAEKTGAEIRVAEPVYPHTLPRLLVPNLLNQSLPANRPLSDLRVGVISAEAVLALKTAFTDKTLPVEKVISVIDKENRVTCVRARIGTPVKDILGALKISTQQGDRIALGGPMTGQGVYSEDMPIMHDTDAIFVQDKRRVISSSDSPCINCGECVRACPARLPVNMLVRLLENGLYEEAAQRYDLLSCVECGLCSYVCVMRIPVFHYMMLGKHELVLREATEEFNG